FYRQKSDPLLQKRKVWASEMGAFLTEAGKTIEKWLDVPIHVDAIAARYWLFFDEEARMHIELYVFDPYDLNQTEAAFFSPWAYLPSKGFYRLEELMFEESRKIVQRHQMG